MWDQEELLRRWVGQRKYKSDFGETKPILPQVQQTKRHLSAVTIHFRKKPISWRPSACDFPRTGTRGLSRKLEETQVSCMPAQALGQRERRRFMPRNPSFHSSYESCGTK